MLIEPSDAHRSQSSGIRGCAQLSGPRSAGLQATSSAAVRPSSGNAKHFNMAAKTESDTHHTEQIRRSHDSDGKVTETQEIEGVNATHASIMATNKPDQWGRGYVRLYMLAACIFLNSTMNGQLFTHLIW